MPRPVAGMGEDDDVGEMIVESVDVGEVDHGFVAFVDARGERCAGIVGYVADDLQCWNLDFGNPVRVVFFCGCEDEGNACVMYMYGFRDWCGEDAEMLC